MISHHLAPCARGRWALSSQPWRQQFTVAVVGNAQSLFAQGHGQAIDRHDVVIRINRAAMLHQDHMCHVHSHGARTDVWCMWRYREYEHERINQPPVRCQMGWWLESPPDPTVANIDSTWFIHRTLPATPSTGLMTLAWLSQQPCKVTVYGFDWKTTPTFTDPSRASEQASIHNFALERQICQDHFGKELGYEFC